MTQEEATKILLGFLGDGHEVRENGDSEFYFIFSLMGKEE